MAINIDELLSELEGAEKTAEETFVSGVTSDTSAEDTTEEKVAEADVEETVETEEKVAEKTETEVQETEEKVAQADESEEEKVAQATDQDKELVKQAMDMGRIAAHTFYGELVAMGIMPATNKDMVVPPISSISMPSDSPVTLKADAALQVEAGHDGYDARAQQQQGQKKTASVVTPEFLTNLHNKIYSEE